jgi:hypothetical protein
VYVSSLISNKYFLFFSVTIVSVFFKLFSLIIFLIPVLLTELKFEFVKFEGLSFVFIFIIGANSFSNDDLSFILLSLFSNVDCLFKVNLIFELESLDNCLVKILLLVIILFSCKIFSFFSSSLLILFIFSYFFLFII